MANNASPDRIPLLMTRPRASAEAFVASLTDHLRVRVKPVYSPLIAITSLNADPEISPTNAVIFTSGNGVTHAPKGKGRTAFCVGPATTQAARRSGWIAEMRGETAQGLVNDLIQNPPQQRLVHLSGVHTRGDVCAQLVENGLHAENIAVYDQIAQKLSTEAHPMLTSGQAIIAPLFSPRTAAQLANQAPRAASLYAVAISYTVAQTLEGASYAAVNVAAAPNSDAMLEALATVVSDLSPG